MENRTRQIKKASAAGIAGNGILAVMKITAGLAGGSAALVGAGIDTATDIISSLISFIAADISVKPPDKEHPYGHGRAEAIAAKILSFIIIFAGAQLLYTSFRDLISGSAGAVPSMFVVYVTLVSIGGKIFLYVYKIRIGRRINSQMVIADAENMKADIILSSSVLAGLALTLIFRQPLIDPVMAMAVGLWIIRSGFGIFMEGTDELMEGASDSGVYRSVFEALKTVEGVSNPHRVRIRKINIMYIIDLDIEVDGRLSVNSGHRLAMKAEQAIREAVDNVYDVLVHVEPGGNEESGECYGLTEDSLD